MLIASAIVDLGVLLLHPQYGRDTVTSGCKRIELFCTNKTDTSRNAELAAIAFLFWLALAAAEKRVALVIGNAAYLHASEFNNPLNDANDFAAALGWLGFTLVGGRA